jgi:hypothetical protein
VDLKAHGWFDVYSARRAFSSNIFFYAVGGGVPYNKDFLWELPIFPKVWAFQGSSMLQSLWIG